MNNHRIFERTNGKPTQVPTEEIDEATQLALRCERAVKEVERCVVREHDAYQSYRVAREETRIATDKLKAANDRLNHFMIQRAKGDNAHGKESR